MKKFTRNMLALLLAAAMVLSLVPAFAEAPAQTNAQAVLEKGGTLKLASDTVLDAQPLAGLRAWPWAAQMKKAWPWSPA